MVRIKTKDLKNSYLFRVYDEEENKVFERATKMFANNFDSKSDMVKYFALVGADKLLGDNAINQSINFSEIRKYLQSIDERLSNIMGRQKMDYVQTNAEIKTNQSLLNLITKLLNKISNINIHNYTNNWKYTPLDEYGLDEEKQNYAKVGNTQEVENIDKQIEIAKKYLPKQLSREEIEKIIKSLDDKSIGSVMKHFKLNYNGKCDMKLVQEVLKGI